MGGRFFGVLMMGVVAMTACSTSNTIAREGAAMTVGAGGGTVVTADGAATVEIPPGALPADVTITVTPVDPPAPGAVGQVFEIGPTGTTFAVPITLRFRYRDADLGGRAPDELAVATIDSGAWRPLDGRSLDVATKTVSGQTTHLSPYGLAFVPSSAPSPCVEGTWDHDGVVDTACVPWTTCPAGTHVTSAPSATSDRRCSACASGTFSTTMNAASCTPWTTCLAGTYVSSPGSATSDRQCTACDAGTYSSVPNQSSCLPLGVCAAGTEQTAPGTSTTPPTCSDCEVGTYCPGGTTAKQACAGETWDHDASSATACVAWTSCIDGQHVAANGTATTDRTCAACPSETFSVGPNAPSCTPWTTCEPGKYVSVPGSATADRQCSPCPPGTTSTLPNAPTCTAKPAVEVVAGAGHTCARVDDGTLRCWGRNFAGQLGDGTTVNKSVPTQVQGLSGVEEVAIGGGHTCARLTDGTAWCWGWDSSHQLGDGDGATVNRSAPAQVAGLSGVAQLAAGSQFTCARLTDKTVRCWGNNLDGQLGDGTSISPRESPTPVADLTGVVDIRAGELHACALLEDASVRCWGRDVAGAVGGGAGGIVQTPVTVLTGAAGIAVGADHSCALLTNGTVSCWGDNLLRQLGDGILPPNNPPANSLVPVQVPGLSGVTDIVAGAYHTCALITGGEVRCWGGNTHGAYGLGNNTTPPGPIEIPWLFGVTPSAGGSYMCGLFDGTTIRCAGSNGYGQIGDGTTTERLLPALVLW